MITLITCIGLDYDCDYLSHFFEYYRNKGIDRFKPILHQNKHDRMESAKSCIVEHIQGLPIEFHAWQGQYDSREKVKRLNEVIQGIPDGEWIVLADVDEFIRFPFPLSEVEKNIKKDYQYGVMVDKIATSRNPEPLTPSPSIFEQFPIEVHWTRKLQACCVKPVIFKKKADTKLKSAHYLMERPLIVGFLFHNPWKIDHFKWVASTKEKLIDRVQHFSEINMSHWRESDMAINRYYAE